MEEIEEEEETAFLFKELTGFEKSGISLQMDDYPVSPMQILQARPLREDVVLMRDYGRNEQGDIEKVSFTIVEIHDENE